MSDAMGYAERTSGAVPLLGRDTAPSGQQQTHLPVPTTPIHRREGGTAIEEAVTPIRSTSARDRATDLMKTTIQLPQMVWLIGAAIAIAAAFWTTRTEVQLMHQRIDFEARLREGDKETFMQAFKALEAKIDAARNGSAALSAMQDNERLRQEISKLRGQ